MNEYTFSNINNSDNEIIKLKRETEGIKKVYDCHNYSYILNSITLLFSELKKTEQNQSSQTKIDEVILKCKMTDIIQKFLDICNPNFKNFKLRLEME